MKLLLLLCAFVFGIAVAVPVTQPVKNELDESEVSLREPEWEPYFYALLFSGLRWLLQPESLQ